MRARGESIFAPLRSKIVSFQSISDLNGAIASLADWGQKISCEFFEIKMKKFRKSMKHKGLVSNPCSKSAPRQGFVGILPENLEMSTLHISTNIRPPSSVSFGFTCRNGTPRLVASFSTIGHQNSLVESKVTPIFDQIRTRCPRM